MKFLSGFTLLIVLVFLHVFALLALNSLSQSALLTKAAADQYQAAHLLVSTENGLLQLEKKVSQDCLIHPLSSASLLKKPFSWWQTHACIVKQENRQFYYVREFLGKDQCCIIKQNHIAVVEFYRLSLFAAHHNSEILLQSTIASPSDEKPICTNTPHTMVTGRQMLREIK